MKLEEKLGFDKIREFLAGHCLSPLGERWVSKISFSADLKQIKKWLTQTEELKSILSAEEGFPQSNYFDLTEALEKSKVPGAFLEPEEFGTLRAALNTILDARDFLIRHAEQYPELSQLAQAFFLDRSLLKSIDHKIDEKSQIRDKASPELATIRKKLISEQQHLRKTLDRVFRTVKGSGYIPEGSSLTIRDGRMVIPVAAEHKKRIKGFIHDESATGHTVFIEPAEALDINNSLRELTYAEKREMIKILIGLTDEMRTQIEPLKEAFYFLGLIDFIRAKARLAKDLNAVAPEIKPLPGMDWKAVFHPLLFFSHQQTGKQVVPLDIRLEKACKILIISGPNAGGKSVALKTVGLTQYMLQCGLLVPMDETSAGGIFENIFIDIGDEQSIENDLSTYSSHLTNMKWFLRKSAGHSLVLLDEFGTGTEPQFGAAIAEAILQVLLEKGVYGVITTHYSNIKAFAEEHAGIQNGAMQFDLKTLEPLYRLEVGRPGSSFALEIAGKIGLPPEVLARAEQLLGKDRVDFDKMLNELDKEKQEVSKKEKELSGKEKELNQLKNRYETLKTELETNQKKIINQAKSEAAEILSTTNKEIEKTIRHIKENRAEKKETLKIRQKLDHYKAGIQKEDTAETKETVAVSGEIRAGDAVRIKGKSMVGEVVDVKEKDAEVMMGDLKSTIKLARLEKVSRQQIRQQQRERKALSNTLDLSNKLRDFSTTLELRGKRGEEALPLLESFLDSGLLFGRNELKILHGKGDGILKQIVREYLRSVDFVKTFRDEDVELGGAGITVVYLK